jgi:hypothetical protein
MHVRSLQMSGLLLLLALALPCASASGPVVHVKTDKELLLALTNETIKTIMVDNDIRFEAADWTEHCGAGPCHLTRNVTITADPSGPHWVSSPYYDF